MIRVLDSAGSTLVEWGRQQQHDTKTYTSSNLQNDHDFRQCDIDN